MSEPAITVSNISKRYFIDHRKDSHRYDGLRHTFEMAIRSPWRWIKALRNEVEANREEFWALKDVSFEVQLGQVVGIIGRNGAGKSTLLKILSRITDPSAGRVVLQGRVASLLEVGTGFHHELTGRENIFLNGAILGMTKAEILAKFDEIVAFSEIEKFLDTPVKRYSSGMHVRLAFAVAAHLEPEILIVDEVLAVGDARFQKKCLGKIQEVARQGGRTVLFVSHNLGAVQALCTHGIVLEKGRITFDGMAPDALGYYCSIRESRNDGSLAKRTDRTGDGRIRFVDAWLEDNQGNKVETVASGQTVRIAAEYVARIGCEMMGQLSVSFALYGAMGEPVSNLWTEISGFEFQNPPRVGVVTCELPRLPLKGGRYTHNICAYINGEIADWIRDAGVLNVEDGDFFGTGRLHGPSHGCVLLEQRWKVDPRSDLSRSPDIALDSQERI